MKLAVTVLVIVTACGGASGGSDAAARAEAADASTLDAAVDALPFGPVTLDVRTMRHDDLAEADAEVVFVDTDGTITRRRTDATGTATAMVAPGATVTVIWRVDNEVRVVTIVSVEPGDRIRVGTPPTADDKITGTSTVTVAATETVTRKILYTSCGDQFFDSTTSTSASMTWSMGCELADDELLVVATDVETGASHYVHAASLHNQPHRDVVIPPPWIPTGSLEATFTGVPAGTLHVDLERSLLSSDRRFYRSAISGEVTGPTLALEVSESPLAGDGMELRTLLRPVQDEATSYHLATIRRRAPVGLRDEHRLLDHALPYVSPPTVDLATRRISWVQAEQGIAADAVIADVVFSRRVAGDAAVRTRWRIIAPGGTRSLALPDELGELWPQPDAVIIGDSLFLLAVDGLDYRQLRTDLDIELDHWRGNGDARAETVSVSGERG